MVAVLTVLALFAPDALENVVVHDPAGAGFLVKVETVPCARGPHAVVDAAEVAPACACGQGAACGCKGQARGEGAGCACGGGGGCQCGGMGGGPGAGPGKGMGQGKGKGKGKGKGNGKGMGMGPGGGGGPMPAALRDTIHALVYQHTKVKRTLTILPDGGETVTISEAPEQVEALRRHVRQMQARLAEGKRVRAWDPVYAQLAEHYGDTTLTVEDVPGGVKVTHKGKTPAAARLVHAHAQVVSGLVARGPEEAHRCHVVR